MDRQQRTVSACERLFFFRFLAAVSLHRQNSVAVEHMSQGWKLRKETCFERGKREDQIFEAIG